jgi:hypothetical protein
MTAAPASPPSSSLHSRCHGMILEVFIISSFTRSVLMVSLRNDFIFQTVQFKQIATAKLASEDNGFICVEELDSGPRVRLV